MKIITTTEHAVLPTGGKGERILSADITEVPYFDRIKIEPDAVILIMEDTDVSFSREAAEQLHAALGHALRLQYDMEPTSAPVVRPVDGGTRCLG